MRALIWITLVVAALWGGYWFTASRAVDGAVEDWFAAQEAGGMIAEKSALTVAGFPNRIDVTAENLYLADPGSGIGWRTPFAQVFSMTWKPWHLIAALPTDQKIELPDQVVTLEGEGIMASLELHPGPALALNRTRAEAGQLRLTSTAGWQVAADKIAAATDEDATLANTHRLGLRVEGFVPDAGFLARIIGSDLPGRIERANLDAFASFSAPIDRHAGETRPQLTELDLRELRLDWGSLQISGRGTLRPDAAGLAEGEIAFRIQGWRRMMPVLVALGAITEGQAQALERGLAALIAPGADPEVLDLSLRAGSGRMSLGPLPLGPAPRLR